MKEMFKTLARGTARIMILPAYLLYLTGNLFIEKKKNFQGFSECFSNIPGLIGEYLRREFYRLTLAECSKDCCISFGVLFSSYKASIGRGVYIGPFSMIGYARIGDYTLISSSVQVLSGSKQHYFDKLDVPIKEQGGEFNLVEIGEDCWLGNGTVVMANVGQKSVIGVRSVVNKDIPPYSIAVGSPAKVIRSRK